MNTQLGHLLDSVRSSLYFRNLFKSTKIIQNALQTKHRRHASPDYSPWTETNNIVSQPSKQLCTNAVYGVDEVCVSSARPGAM